MAERKRISNKQIWSEVGRLADEMDEANGRQRELTKELITVKTRQEECPIWKGGKLNDPRVMLLMISGIIGIIEIASRIF